MALLDEKTGSTCSDEEEDASSKKSSYNLEYVDVFPLDNFSFTIDSETSVDSKMNKQEDGLAPIEDLVAASRDAGEDVKHQILTEKAKMYINPHDPGACRDYRIMKQEEHDFKNRPEWDSSEHCHVRDMIESKRDNAYAQALLERTRIEQANSRIERNKEIQDLKNDEQTFGASFIHYDAFVKDNVEKRERAFEKIAAENIVKAGLDVEIIQAEEKLKTLMEIKDDMLQCIADRKIYVDFLEEVRALAPAQYSNGVKEIADRFEFGRLLQQLLCTVSYIEVAGLSYVEWDAVGITSHFMNHCLEEPEVLDSISGHYSTGDKLPVTDMRKVTTHMAGTVLCSQLYKSALDLKMNIEKKFWLQLVHELWPQYFVYSLHPEYAEPLSMADIVTQDSCSSYYSNVWSRMIAADAYSAFKDNGADAAAVGTRFRDTYFEFGGGCDPHETFRRFRGRDPSMESYLRYLNLKTSDVEAVSN